jgi:hypothetical protein
LLLIFLLKRLAGRQIVVYAGESPPFLVTDVEATMGAVEMGSDSSVDVLHGCSQRSEPWASTVDGVNIFMVYIPAIGTILAPDPRVGLHQRASADVKLLVSVISGFELVHVCLLLVFEFESTVTIIY